MLAEVEERSKLPVASRLKTIDIPLSIVWVVRYCFDWNLVSDEACEHNLRSITIVRILKSAWSIVVGVAARRCRYADVQMVGWELETRLNDVAMDAVVAQQKREAVKLTSLTL